MNKTKIEAIAVADAHTTNAELPSYSDLMDALSALLDWGRENTSPIDSNTPHALLLVADAALQKLAALS